MIACKGGNQPAFGVLAKPELLQHLVRMNMVIMRVGKISL